MKPFINCSSCCDYCLATECNYRKTESLTYTTTEPIKTEDKQMKENEKQFLESVEEAKRRLASSWVVDYPKLKELKTQKGK